LNSRTGIPFACNWNCLKCTKLWAKETGILSRTINGIEIDILNAVASE